MSDLTKFISEEFIVVPMRAGSADGAILELLKPLENKGIIDSSEVCRETILKRERRMSTGVGKGVALPHGLSDGLKEVAVVLGLSREGINYRAVDNMLCHIFILMISPSDKPEKHLKMLSRFSKALDSGSFRSALLAARTPAQAMHVLADLDDGGEEEI
ncbi:MAG: PTS sugar transporter subunit IIA [Candidatus Marinimicrobia bacterium]|nr:PTS sugar transporter subunit IIA [Candidatus Neomarinimicrobiota bacterium]